MKKIIQKQLIKHINQIISNLNTHEIPTIKKIETLKYISDIINKIDIDSNEQCDTKDKEIISYYYNNYYKK